MRGRHGWFDGGKADTVKLIHPRHAGVKISNFSRAGWNRELGQCGNGDYGWPNQECRALKSFVPAVNLDILRNEQAPARDQFIALDRGIELRLPLTQMHRT